MTNKAASPAEVLAFWFGAAPLKVRDIWFRKSEAFDADVRERFGPLVEVALAGALSADWHAVAPSKLAKIVLLDLFTRKIFRDTPRAFAGDFHALGLARSLIDADDDRTLPPLQRWFVYLPLEHAEDLPTQQLSVQLFQGLAEEDSALAGASDYAQRHHDVIARFGRFPHRNRILDRASSPEEIEYLSQPGSGF